MAASLIQPKITPWNRMIDSEDSIYAQKLTATVTTALIAIGAVTVVLMALGANGADLGALNGLTRLGHTGMMGLLEITVMLATVDAVLIVNLVRHHLSQTVTPERLEAYDLGEMNASALIHEMLLPAQYWLQEGTGEDFILYFKKYNTKKVELDPPLEVEVFKNRAAAERRAAQLKLDSAQVAMESVYAPAYAQKLLEKGGVDVETRFNQVIDGKAILPQTFVMFQAEVDGVPIYAKRVYDEKGVAKEDSYYPVSQTNEMLPYLELNHVYTLVDAHKPHKDLAANQYWLMTFPEAHLYILYTHADDPQIFRNLATAQAAIEEDDEDLGAKYCLALTHEAFKQKSTNQERDHYQEWLDLPLQIGEYAESKAFLKGTGNKATTLYVLVVNEFGTNRVLFFNKKGGFTGKNEDYRTNFKTHHYPNYVNHASIAPHLKELKEDPFFFACLQPGECLTEEIEVDGRTLYFVHTKEGQPKSQFFLTEEAREEHLQQPVNERLEWTRNCVTYRRGTDDKPGFLGDNEYWTVSNPDLGLFMIFTKEAQWFYPTEEARKRAAEALKMSDARLRAYTPEEVTAHDLETRMVVFRATLNFKAEKQYAVGTLQLNDVETVYWLSIYHAAGNEERHYFRNAKTRDEEAKRLSYTKIDT